MALEVEVWRPDIVSHLYKGNEFAVHSVNADEYVLAGKVVHIPNAGAAPGVVRNRTTFPATVVRRVDVDVTYPLDEFSTNPTHIHNLETIQYSYDKRMSVLQESMSTLKENAMDWLVRSWSPTVAGRIIRTTGVATAATAPDATGNRLGFTKEELKKARLIFNKENVPHEDRYALIPSDLMDFLLEDPDLMKRDKSLELDVKNGVITRIYGFNLIERSTVSIYTNAATPVIKDPGAATAATDNQMVLVWQKQSVERALGDINMFEDLNSPTYYGDIYSQTVNMGGRIRRSDNKGVLAIVEAASA